MSIELPVQDPCEICESLAGRDERHIVICEGEQTLTVMNPWQYETGQCVIVTRRHIGTLLELSDAEARETLIAARRVAQALNAAFAPLGILVLQNNGVYSGQSVPHYHLHVIPRQPGSNWGIGPPQLATFADAGRARGTPHDPANDAQRHQRAQVDAVTLHRTAARIRMNLP